MRGLRKRERKHEENEVKKRLSKQKRRGDVEKLDGKRRKQKEDDSSQMEEHFGIRPRISFRK